MCIHICVNECTHTFIQIQCERERDWRFALMLTGSEMKVKERTEGGAEHEPQQRAMEWARASMAKSERSGWRRKARRSGEAEGPMALTEARNRWRERSHADDGDRECGQCFKSCHDFTTSRLASSSSSSSSSSIPDFCRDRDRVGQWGGNLSEMFKNPKTLFYIHTSYMYDCRWYYVSVSENLVQRRQTDRDLSKCVERWDGLPRPLQGLNCSSIKIMGFVADIF